MGGAAEFPISDGFSKLLDTVFTVLRAAGYAHQKQLDQAASAVLWLKKK